MSTSPPDLPDPTDSPSTADDDDAAVTSVLSWALPPGRRSDALRERLLTRARTTTVATLRRDEGMWFPVGPGVSRKLVFSDSQDRGTTALWRFDAGSTAPVAAEGGDVVLVPIEGSITIHDGHAAVALAVGDAVGVHGIEVVVQATTAAAVLVAATLEAIDGPPGMEVSRAAGVAPVDMDEAVQVRPLFLDRAPRPDVALLSVRPNGAVAEHEHPETEELFCLEGRCLSHGVRLEPGDYQRTRAGAAHDATTSDTGSTILVLRRHFT